MRPPRKAFILAAGLGTRLRPLTLETPKPMLPLWDRPLLERTLEQVAAWGVRDVLINLHHAPGPIVRHLAVSPLLTCALLRSSNPSSSAPAVPCAMRTGSSTNLSGS